ncbi:MAG: hypothetical protein ACP5UO_00025 [Thermoplasmata archaeon]
MPSHKYDNLVHRARIRRKVRGMVVIAVVLVVSLVIVEGAIHLQVHERTVSVDLTYFTDTLIQNGTAILVPAFSYYVITVNLHHDSAIQGSFRSSLPVIMYIFALNEYDSFATGQIFGYIFSTGITNGTQFTASAIPGTYYIVFSNPLGNVSVNVVLTSAFVASYSL